MWLLCLAEDLHEIASLIFSEKQQEMWKFHKNQVFQLLHETRKTFQVQSIELMYFSFNNIYDIWDEFRVN